LEYLTVNSNFRKFCWLHTKTGPSKVGDAVTPPGSWTTSGSLSQGFSQQDFSNQSFIGHSGYIAESNVVVFSQLEVARHSGLCYFHTMPWVPNH